MLINIIISIIIIMVFVFGRPEMTLCDSRDVKSQEIKSSSSNNLHLLNTWHSWTSGFDRT